MDKRINDTYVAGSTASLSRFAYDSYIRAIRWASDRLKEKGVICFVTNGSFLDGNAMDGLRKCLADEFTSIYIFNLRGNQRTSGETSRMEGGKIFDSGSRATIAITLLVKNPDRANPHPNPLPKGEGAGTLEPSLLTATDLLEPSPFGRGQGEGSLTQGEGAKPTAEIYYHDIGDYLDRKEKLQIIADFKSMAQLPMKRLKPNSSHDWINQRDPAFDAFLPLGDKSDKHAVTLFDNYSLGVATNRDAWTYNFSKDALIANMGRMIDFYNEEVDRYKSLTSRENIKIDTFISQDATQISWSRGLKNDLKKDKSHSLEKKSLRMASYRPYFKEYLYFNTDLNEVVSQMPKIFPTAEHDNLVICTPGKGSSNEFSPVLVNVIPDLNFMSAGAQSFPLYTYEKVAEDTGVNTQPSLLASETGTVINGYRRKDNIPDAMLAYFQEAYPPEHPHPNPLPKGEGAGIITKEDIFYYVYGVLHSPEYKERFEADLKKMLPRLPLTKTTADFWQFSKIGRELAHWHLNYESIEPYDLEEVKRGLVLDEYDFYRIDKMSFPKGQKYGDKPDTIIYNNRLSLQGIPPQAWDYVVNGKPALSWIMERYAVTVHKESQIKNDPNLWCVEQESPRYIVDLVKRVTRVAVESVRLVAMLPALNERV